MSAEADINMDKNKPQKQPTIGASCNYTEHPRRFSEVSSSKWWAIKCVVNHRRLWRYRGEIKTAD